MISVSFYKWKRPAAWCDQDVSEMARIDATVFYKGFGDLAQLPMRLCTKMAAAG
jgi:hypothetical protein